MLKLLLMKLFNRKEYEWENEWTRDVFLGGGMPIDDAIIKKRGW